MNHELQDAASVGARASILDVRQVVVSANLKRVTDAPLHAEVDHTFDWRLEGTTLLCQAGCDVRITERETGEDVFDATVVYGCGFALSEVEGLAEAAYEEFAKVNATLCLYPYLRESVQSLTSRAGLPPFVLATLRVPVAVGAATDAQPADSAADSIETNKGSRPAGKKSPASRTAAKRKPKKAAGPKPRTA